VKSGYANQSFIQHPAATLLSARVPDPALWYGDPLGRQHASGLQRAAQAELHSRLCRGESSFSLHVLRLVCAYRMASGSSLEYEQLVVQAREDNERALLELVYGQLLISCKLLPANRHLARGFQLAAGLLAPAEYFCLLRRHELLGLLPLSDIPVPPLKLVALLREATVIERLRQADYLRHDNTHTDTVG
jgi:hypothetical protein